MSTDATLENRVAIITGAGRGIGAAIARLFAAQGAKVVLNDLGANPDGTGADAGPAQVIADEINAAGGQALANGGDIADTTTGEELVRLATEELGGLHIVVNVAGILRDKMIFNLAPEDWDAVVRVHMRGTYSTIRPASAYWREQRNPDGHYRIINFSSNSGLFGSAGQPNYAAAKMGIVGLTYSLARGLSRYGVTANAIAPSAMTRLVAGVLGDPEDEKFADITPENIAPIIAYLAGTKSDWLTGRVIGAMGHNVSLYNNPEPIATVTTEGEWDLDALAAAVEESFRPLADGLPGARYA
jgi:NAD(P)-dependent dehydrogenase (short-subunit alcohol dehydrogenase family)